MVHSGIERALVYNLGFQWLWASSKYLPCWKVEGFRLELLLEEPFLASESISSLEGSASERDTGWLGYGEALRSLSEDL